MHGDKAVEHGVGHLDLTIGTVAPGARAADVDPSIDSAHGPDVRCAGGALHDEFYVSSPRSLACESDHELALASGGFFRARTGTQAVTSTFN